MEKGTGKHYILSAMKRQHADRVPTTVLIGPYCTRQTRYSVREILTDARKSAEAHLAFHDRFNPDSLIVYNDIYLEAEAVGSELEFPADGISHPKRALLEDKTKLARLRVPDPRKDGRMPYFIEVCQRLLSIHICGKIDPIMEDIFDTGVYLLSIDAASSLQKLMEMADRKRMIMGNVPTTHFSSGSRKEMEASIRQCIETAAAASGFILASGCEIPFDSTEDRIDHFFEYSRQYGREYMDISRSKAQGSKVQGFFPK